SHYDLSRRSPRFRLFPYTTLFRSAAFAADRDARYDSCSVAIDPLTRLIEEVFECKTRHLYLRCRPRHAVSVCSYPLPIRRWRSRSEEHTSELQSRENRVCRLLLEK